MYVDPLFYFLPFETLCLIQQTLYIFFQYQIKLKYSSIEDGIVSSSLLVLRQILRLSKPLRK